MIDLSFVHMYIKSKPNNTSVYICDSINPAEERAVYNVVYSLFYIENVSTHYRLLKITYWTSVGIEQVRILTPEILVS